jgi:hypothetical protein
VLLHERKEEFSSVPVLCTRLLWCQSQYVRQFDETWLVLSARNRRHSPAEHDDDDDDDGTKQNAAASLIQRSYRAWSARRRMKDAGFTVSDDDNDGDSDDTEEEDKAVAGDRGIEAVRRCDVARLCTVGRCGHGTLAALIELRAAHQLFSTVVHLIARLRRKAAGGLLVTLTERIERPKPVVVRPKTPPPPPKPATPPPPVKQDEGDDFNMGSGLDFDESDLLSGFGVESKTATTPMKKKSHDDENDGEDFNTGSGALDFGNDDDLTNVGDEGGEKRKLRRAAASDAHEGEAVQFATLDVDADDLLSGI